MAFRVVGINFDHMHMGDLLRMAKDHPGVEIVGVADDDLGRVYPVLDQIGLPRELATEDYAGLLERTRPDLAILCPSTGAHGEWTEKVAPFGTHILMEKPFAATLADADRMIAAVQKTGKSLAINWPLRWYPSHVTAKRLADEGRIGEIIEVHYYDGNRGPLRHLADKIEVPEELAGEKSKSWWYQRAAGGGSLLDYLGYGTTLGTWYMDGRAPIEVCCMVDEIPGLEVDEHSVTVCRYATGLSKFETRWGTFTDPWTLQPQPKCGFVLVGTRGTISTYDYEPTIRLQDSAHPEGVEVPVDVLEAPNHNPIHYIVDRLTRGLPVEGPLSVEIARIGQQIVDSAVLSARQKQTVSLVG